jgi:hypothetical protein
MWETDPSLRAKGPRNGQNVVTELGKLPFGPAVPRFGAVGAIWSRTALRSSRRMTGPDRAARGDVGRRLSDQAQTSSRSFSQVRLVAERWVGACGIAGLGEPSEGVRRRIELSELAEGAAGRPKATRRTVEHHHSRS